MNQVTATRLPAISSGEKSDSLNAWVLQYGKLEAGANAKNTYRAKARDLHRFTDFFTNNLRSDAIDDWTKPITQGFLRDLEEGRGWKPTTINRSLSTLRHFATWVHLRRPFLAGNPVEGISELEAGEPDWKGLSSLEVLRLRSAAERLRGIKGQANQAPLRDLAVFACLLHTGLRVSELLALDRGQYDGRSFLGVKRKGKVRTASVPVPADARQALDAYLTGRGQELGNTGPLLSTGKGKRLTRQQVDRALRQIAWQANAKLKTEERIDMLSAHVLRHTFLRQVARKEGVEFAMELAGHSSSRYIWRYVRPSKEEKAEAVEGLF